jgi:acetyl esterase
MSTYAIHRDFKKLRFVPPQGGLALLIANSILTRMFSRERLPNGIAASDYAMEGYGGGRIRLSIYGPEGPSGSLPCLLYAHGGAFALKAAPYHKALMCEYAAKVPCNVLFVDYRLLPAYPFPTALEDCYAALLWLAANAKRLGVDPRRIAVGGDSAGGALATGIAHLARDRKGPDLRFQMLVYPVLDARQGTESMRTFVYTPGWNSTLNKRMWKNYLANGDHGMRSYASPIEASSFAGLPPAYVEVSEFDCLRDEGKDYADILRANGVETEFVLTKGTIHGFDVFRGSSYAQTIVGARIAALRRAFYPES